ncbi:MAG: hypothetical protein ACYC9Y_05160 [Candidatus Methylomirabilia bacterium]
MKPRTFVLSIAVALAALAGGASTASAQFSCSPATVSAGAEFHLTSAARFGSTQPAGVAVEAFAGAGSPLRLTIRNWMSSDVLVRLPAGMPNGVYGVRITTPAGPPQQNPSCVTVRTLVPAPLRPRTAGTGAVAARLDTAIDADLLCPGPTKITLWGSNFTPGTESSQHLGWPTERLIGGTASAWISGKTMVELGAARDAFPLLVRPIRPQLVIQDAGTMYFTVSQCVLLFPGLKARIWFPDGTKSEWQRVRTDWDH